MTVEIGDLVLVKFCNRLLWGVVCSLGKNGDFEFFPANEVVDDEFPAKTSEIVLILRNQAVLEALAFVAGLEVDKNGRLAGE